MPGLESSTLNKPAFLPYSEPALLLEYWDVSEHVASNSGMIPETEPAAKTPNPVWPELDAKQKARALAATWPSRLRFAFIGAAILACLTGFASYRAAGDVFDWRAGVSLTLGCSFLATYGLIKTQRFSRRWLAPLGQVAIALTLINLMACMMEQFRAGVASQQAAMDPALVFLTLIAGSLWALRVHLSPVGFVLGAAITMGILWAPWIALTEAPIEFALTGLACLAAGAQMRWIGAERAYATYRRKVIWPRLWRGSVQAVALRELSRRTAAMPHAGQSQPLEALARKVDGARVQGSLVSLATALGGSESPASQQEDSEHESSAKTADSKE